MSNTFFLTWGKGESILLGVEHSSTEAITGNGNGVAVAAAPAPSPIPCPLNFLPEETHQYIHNLERRIADLEKEKERFSAALINAGKFIFDNPASKMMLAAFPKEMQNKLREFFGK